MTEPTARRPLRTRIDGPVAVIGDVHGQTDKLLSVLEQLLAFPDIHRRWIVFIGDLVDRGEDPAGTMEVFCNLRNSHEKVTLICGNHELAMAGSLGLLETPDYVTWSRKWVKHYDSESTFESYGVEHGDLDALREAIPDEHIALLSDLPWRVEHPNYLFVHAGLDRNMPYQIQLQILRERDYTLNRPPWLFSQEFVNEEPPADCPVVVVVGHVFVPQIKATRRMLAIDTTGGTQGELSCVLLPENQVITSRADHESVSTPGPPSARPWWKVW